MARGWPAWTRRDRPAGNGTAMTRGRALRRGRTARRNGTSIRRPAAAAAQGLFVRFGTAPRLDF